MLPQPGADRWAASSALSKHGGAAIRAGGGRGPAVTKPSTARAGLAQGPATPRVEILQEENNAAFGKNGATLVVLVEPPAPGKVSASAESPESCLEGRWETPVAAIAFATYRIGASPSILLQAALPQNRDCFSSSSHVTGWKRDAVRLTLYLLSQSRDAAEPWSTTS